MAAHYDSTVLATRPRRPRDRAKVEAAVLIVERWLFERLRRRTFINLAELNAAIAELLMELNDRRVCRGVRQTRRLHMTEGAPGGRDDHAVCAAGNADGGDRLAAPGETMETEKSGLNTAQKPYEILRK